MFRHSAVVLQEERLGCFDLTVLGTLCQVHDEWESQTLLEELYLASHFYLAIPIPHVEGTHHSTHPEAKHKLPGLYLRGERLMVTLRFLATGESFKSLSYQFRMGVSTIGQFVPETCTAIYEVLKEKYLK
ncbi:hypothetical protein F7725_013614, partial [Dissostichus mawsoni]